MDPRGPQIRVSRETRLLLTTAVLALVSLWVLARVRFPDRPAAPTPVQPLLTQLAARPTFDDLAADLVQLQSRIEPLVVSFDLWPADAHLPGTVREPVPALRVGGDAAVVLVDATRGRTAVEFGEQVVRIDPASRLGVVRLPGPPAPPPVPWSPSQPERPRYLVEADVSAARLSLRPVFVGSFAEASSPVWPGSIWLVPATTDLASGSFLFTSDGLLAGLVVDHEGRRAVVPAMALLAEAARLQIPRVSSPGYIGVDVQRLTPPVARATGASSGVVVTAVDPDGPAADQVVAGDILEAADGDSLWTPLHWNTRIARLAAGETINVRLRRGGELRDLTLTAATMPLAGEPPALGLSLQPAARVGAAVVAVQRGSVAEKAGVMPGDVITLIGDVNAPSPAQVRRAFAAAAEGQALLVTITRGQTNLVTALEK
jgi:serine protease Do